MTISTIHHTISDSDRELLQIMDLRQSGLVWLFRTASGAQALAVWNARSNTFEKLELDLGSIDQLEAQGLLTLGTAGALPAPFAHHSGSPVALTDAGRRQARNYTFVRAA